MEWLIHLFFNSTIFVLKSSIKIILIQQLVSTSFAAIVASFEENNKNITNQYAKDNTLLNWQKVQVKNFYKRKKAESGYT